VACDGGTPVGTTSPPAPAFCTQTVVYQRSGRLPADTIVFAGFTTSAPGRLDATVDWTFPATPITLYLADHAPCRVDAPAGSNCGVMASAREGPKPRSVSTVTTTPGNYWLYIHNRGSQDDSAGSQVVLSSPSCPAIASSRGDAAGEGGANRPGVVMPAVRPR